MFSTPRKTAKKTAKTTASTNLQSRPLASKPLKPTFQRDGQYSQPSLSQTSLNSPPLHRRPAPPRSAPTHLQTPTYLQTATRLQTTTTLQSPADGTVPFPQRPGASTVVRPFPAPRSQPPWLHFLLNVHRSSLLITFTLVGATLLVYGNIVATQQTWSRELSRQQVRDRQERQMQTAIEAIKTQLAKQAELPTSGLVPRSPQTQITVPMAPAGSGQPNQVQIPGATVVPPRSIGY